MGMNPTRFAIGISGALACLGIGLVAGVSAGTTHAAHLYAVRTLTVTAPGAEPAAAKTVTVERTVAAHRADAAARTVTHTIVRTVTVPAAAAAGPPTPPAPPKPHRHGHGPGNGPGHGDGPGNGPGNGPGGDGG